MQKTKVLILGASGMAGNMIEKVLSREPTIQLGISIREKEDYYLGKGYTVHTFDALTSSPYFAKDYDYIINCIGAIPSANSTPEENIRLNAIFPLELSKNCKNSKIIHLTTDCIFDCKLAKLEPNDEITASYGRDYYALTKYLGEVDASNVLNLRCSILGPELHSQQSFFERFLADSNPKGWSNVEWNGITTYHLAQIIRGIIIHANMFFAGTQHIIPNGVVTRHQMMEILNELNWGVPKKEVKSIKFGSSLNRKLSTASVLNNLLLWKGAGYASAPNFTTMALELNKIYWHFGYAKDRGFVLGEGEY
jgi:dTDP-4-dehydrorhamnose reductase